VDGGKRGRPPKREEDKLHYRGIGLTNAQWAALEALSWRLGSRLPSTLRLAVDELLKKHDVEQGDGDG